LFEYFRDDQAVNNDTLVVSMPIMLQLFVDRSFALNS
jgi:hypothetical protein